MSYKLILKTNASIEIEDVIAYYSKINISIAKKLEVEIRNAFELVCKNPESFQYRYFNVRICWLDKFPYGIYYIFEKDEVFILAFWHQKEDIEDKISQIL